MEIPGRAISQAVATLLASDARSAVKYVTPKLIVRATHRSRTRRNAAHVELVLTLGRPNHAERAFIRDCQKAEVDFPVVRAQLRPWPKKKAAR